MIDSGGPVSGSGYAVGQRGLAEHGTWVDELAARLARASDAATVLDRGAYGILGQGFAALVADSVTDADRTVAALAELLGRHARLLRASGAAYDGVEVDHVAGFGGLAPGVGGGP